MKLRIHKKLFYGIISIAVVGVIILLQPQSDQTVGQTNTQTTGDTKSSLSDIEHVHGLAVDVADPKRLYIATHQGLFVLVNDIDFSRLSKNTDDYMGFSPHPANPQVFFSSGHPSFGGNLGVQKSTDGGSTWEKISSGMNGPVDFHAMMVSRVNPDLLYGWFMGALQRSEDGGKNWQVVKSNLQDVLNLSADAHDENTLYAGTLLGLMRSTNKGESWELLSPQLQETAITAFAVHPENAEQMLSYSAELGLAKSSDGGQTWEKGSLNVDALIVHLVYSKTHPEIVYAMTQDNTLYKSSDGGEVWNIVK